MITSWAGVVVTKLATASVRTTERVNLILSTLWEALWR
jgi:hypothetical protein